MKAELVPSNGDPPIPIVKDVTVVGRREFCDVTIEHPSLSKRHCVVVRTDGLLMIRDLLTTNGTKVNGQRVMWAALLPNDRLTLGRYKFRIYLGPDDAPSPSELRGKVIAASPPRPAPVPSSRPSVVAPAAAAPLMAIPVGPDTDDDEDVIEVVGADDLLIEDESEEELEILDD